MEPSPLHLSLARPLPAEWIPRKGERGQQERTLRKKEDFLRAFHNAFGNISLACRIAKVKSRKTIYNWMESDPKFKETLEMSDQIQLDTARDILWKKIVIDHNLSAIRYYLNHHDPDFKTPTYSRPPRRNRKTVTTDLIFNDLVVQSSDDLG